MSILLNILVPKALQLEAEAEMSAGKVSGKLFIALQHRHYNYSLIPG